MVDAVFFLYYRDIFSVAKDKGFLSCPVAKLATIYAQLGFKLDLELSIICFEFCFVFLYWWCFCWAGESAILLLLILTRFLDVFVYLCCLMTRDIWCGVFELIFATSSACLKRCAFSYLPVSGVRLASCRAVCFPALVKFWLKYLGLFPGGNLFFIFVDV